MLGLQVDEGEIGVRADLDPALARLPEAVRGAGRRQPRDRLERQRALVMALGQQERQGCLATSYPAPRVAERALLELGVGGRVVARDEPHGAAAYLLPQALPLVALAHRRRALGHRAERLDVLRRQREIVRAGLARHV